MSPGTGPAATPTPGHGAGARPHATEQGSPRVRHIATFCGSCNCGCPELHVDDTATPDKRIVITDDFGQRVQMSTDQFADLVGRGAEALVDS